MKKLKASLMIILVMVLILTQQLAEQEVQAVTKYITADEFIKLLVQEIKLEVDPNSNEPYLDAAVKAGIVKNEELKIFYFVTISRSSAAVFINRADEYLHGDTVKKELVKVVLNKRISDIDKVPEGMREDVAKCFAKGIIKGYGNGYYIQNRSFKGDDKISEATAKSYINLITNTSKRAKLSPDGKLIRTTNLPKNADKYDYILACYPNKFYERKFDFMFGIGWKEKDMHLYTQHYPVEMKNTTFRTWDDKWPFSREMDKYLYDWTDKAETYLKYLFNVDYRTVDDKWVKGLASCYVKSNLSEEKLINEYYLKPMKKNKVIVESSIIAVEPSTLYEDGDYCMRAYVKYRIKAKNIKVKQYQLLRCQNPVLKDLKNGEWRTGIFDIRFGTNNGTWGDGSYWAIESLTFFVDDFNVSIK